MQQVQQKVKTVLFVNFSDQPFSAIEYMWPNRKTKEMELTVDDHCKWDNIPESFQPGEKRYMEDWRAAHFARHLVNRELDKQGKALDDVTLRDKMIKQCIMAEGKEVPIQNVDMEIMNRQHEVTSDFVAPKAEKNEVKKVKKAKEEFADLKE